MAGQLGKHWNILSCEAFQRSDNLAINAAIARSAEKSTAAHFERERSKKMHSIDFRQLFAIAGQLAP